MIGVNIFQKSEKKKSKTNANIRYANIWHLVFCVQFQLAFRFFATGDRNSLRKAKRCIPKTLALIVKVELLSLHKK